ncbi:hypothetical protein ABEB36_015462 [Hypothenemus hampei]|uniref:Uncharacterized protein n=1 Tax=Hypothenemus hampei TaxID=57062 RepID=A0ABD1E0B9_HYPHA
MSVDSLYKTAKAKLSFLDSVSQHRFGGSNISATPHELPVNEDSVGVDETLCLEETQDTVFSNSDKERICRDVTIELVEGNEVEEGPANVMENTLAKSCEICRHMKERMQKKHLGEVVSDYEIMAASQQTSSLSHNNSASHYRTPTSSSSELPSPSNESSSLDSILQVAGPSSAPDYSIPEPTHFTSGAFFLHGSITRTYRFVHSGS